MTGDGRLPSGGHLADYPVVTRLETRWRDNDVYGHVNNVVYYEYFDTAVNAWLHEQVGRVAREGEAIGVVAETTCRYLREVSFPQQVLVGLGCERLGTTSVTYRLAIFAADEVDAGPAALGRFVHVYVDRAARRPVAVPAPVREAVSRVLVPPPDPVPPAAAGTGPRGREVRGADAPAGRAG